MVSTKQHEMRVLICCVYMVLIALFTCGSLAAEEYVLSKGQTVYVPVYSNIYGSAKKVPIHLANILSIRNTDTAHAIRVLHARIIIPVRVANFAIVQQRAHGCGGVVRDRDSYR